jgi:hypothetical protein
MTVDGNTTTATQNVVKRQYRSVTPTLVDVTGEVLHRNCSDNYRCRPGTITERTTDGKKYPNSLLLDFRMTVIKHDYSYSKRS